MCETHTIREAGNKMLTKVLKRQRSNIGLEKVT